MALTFLPSLQHLAAVRVALTVCNDDIVDLLGKRNWNFERDGDCTKLGLAVKRKTMRKLSKLLPKSQKALVVNIIRSIIAEVHFWVRDHFDAIKQIEIGHYSNSLRWKSQGTIDRPETAKQLIRNERIDKGARFSMACTYCLQDDVQQLWQRMTEDERLSVSLMDSPNLAVLFWTRWLKENARDPWTECLGIYLNQDYLLPKILNGEIHKFSRVRLSSFFIESWNDRLFFLRHLWERHMHSDDLLLCYKRLDEAKRAEAFSGVPETSDVLCCYLDWPLQSLFLDAVKEMMSHSTKLEFYRLLRHIVKKKLAPGMQDFDYLELFKDLWDLIPGAAKERIQKRGGDLEVISYVLSFYEKTRSPLGEKFLLDRYFLMTQLQDYTKKYWW